MEQVNERLNALNSWIRNAVVNGARVNYDRSSVLNQNYTHIDFADGSATVSIPHRDSLRNSFEEDTSGQPVGGTCRELSQWAAVNMVRDGVVDEAEVYACATQTEAHYVVIAKLDGQQYVVDLAYSQPVLEAIPVDGLEYKSTAYAGEKGSKQAFSGEITYQATAQADGTILFTVEAPNRSTEFPLQLLTDELDQVIPGAWSKMTGSGYATRVSQNPDGETFRVDSEPVDEDATLQEQFKDLHTLAKQFGRDAVKVVFRSKDQ